MLTWSAGGVRVPAVAQRRCALCLNAKSILRACTTPGESISPREARDGHEPAQKPARRALRTCSGCIIDLICMLLLITVSRTSMTSMNCDCPGARSARETRKKASRRWRRPVWQRGGRRSSLSNPCRRRWASGRRRARCIALAGGPSRQPSPSQPRRRSTLARTKLRQAAADRSKLRPFSTRGLFVAPRRIEKKMRHLTSVRY